MAKKVYIATPVNGRKEVTLTEKRKAAYDRIKEIEYIISKSVNGAEFAEFHSSFDGDIAPLNVELTKKMFGYELPSEAVIMGRCVQRVMECDMVVLDLGWEKSKGCRVEHQTAVVYEKEVYVIERNAFFVRLVKVPF